MHELSIASAILEKVEAESRRYPDARFVRVGIRIGELSAVDPDALQFGFTALVKDSGFESLELAIEFCARRQLCPGCSFEFAAPESETSCPQCGETETACVAGHELDIAYMEVEDA
jgi:hydrogenase nickel incorporation protein HypA/HybF